jgi:hypothetical protein
VAAHDEIGLEPAQVLRPEDVALLEHRTVVGDHAFVARVLRIGRIAEHVVAGEHDLRPSIIPCTASANSVWPGIQSIVNLNPSHSNDSPSLKSRSNVTLSIGLPSNIWPYAWMGAQ